MFTSIVHRWVIFSHRHEHNRWYWRFLLFSQCLVQSLQQFFRLKSSWSMNKSKFNGENFTVVDDVNESFHFFDAHLMSVQPFTGGLSFPMRLNFRDKTKSSNCYRTSSLAPSSALFFPTGLLSFGMFVQSFIVWLLYLSRVLVIIRWLNLFLYFGKLHSLFFICAAGS